jgi:NADH-quinone oxidoreductase subunit J
VTATQIVFYVLGALAVLSGLAVIFQRSALYSALALIVTLVSMALIFIQLGAPFLAAIQVIVYAGAIMVCSSSSSCS